MGGVVNPLKGLAKVFGAEREQRIEARRIASIEAWQTLGDMPPDVMLRWMQNRLESRTDIPAGQMQDFANRIDRHADDLFRRIRVAKMFMCEVPRD